MTPGRLAIEQRQTAREFSAAWLIARDAHCPIQERAFHGAAVHYVRASHRSLDTARHLAAARNRRLGVPSNYFADAPAAPRQPVPQETARESAASA